MNYILALDTQDLDDEFGYGVAMIYGTTERGTYFIQEEIIRQDRPDFESEVERLKERYQPSEIKAWGV